jgi:hypothetical protein
MASLRDKLKAKNAENAAERGNTSTEDTVFADFINRTEPEQEQEAGNKLSEQQPSVQEESNKQDKEPDTPENNSIKKDTVKQPVKQKTKAKKPANQSNHKEKEVKVPDKTEEKSDKETNELILQKNDKQVTLTISIPPEIDEYLNIKPAMLAEPIKKVFRDSIIKAANSPIDNSLASQFRKTQHSCIKRTIQVNESFREIIRKEAIKFKMKPTSFITYCLTKVYNEDEEYQKAMTEDK